MIQSPNIDLDSLRAFVARLPSSNSSSKRQFILPMFTASLVMYSPGIACSLLSNRQGYITASDLIWRLAVECPTYSSLLDAHFAQEEYQWLHHRDFFKRSTAAQDKKWASLIQRLPLIEYPDTFKLMTKVVFHKFAIGCHINETKKQCVSIKRAALTVKTKLDTSKEPQTLLSLMQQPIQADAMIERPVIYLCNDQDDADASAAWISVLTQEKQSTSSPWLEALWQHVTFYLELSNFSVSLSTMDLGKTANGPLPPRGFIDNTPSEMISAQVALHADSMTFVFNSSKTLLHLCALSIEQTSHAISSEQPDPQLILWISELHVSKHQTLVPLQVVAHIKKYGICYSVNNHYVCLLAARSLSRLLSSLPIRTGLVTPQKRRDVQLKIHVDRGDVRLNLASTANLYLRMDQVSSVLSPSGRFTAIVDNLAILGISRGNNGWNPLVELDSCELTFDAHLPIDLVLKKIFLRVPYQYILADILDCLIHHIKAVKALHARILNNNGNHFTYFSPATNNVPIQIRPVKIKSNMFLIHFDDDPFEARLQTIFRCGLVEQEKRQAYKEAFEKKINGTPQDEAEEQDCEGNNLPTEREIQDAGDDLSRHFSQLWIKNIDRAISTQASFYQSMYVAHDYRHPFNADTLDSALDQEVRDQEAFSSWFQIDILPRPLFPPLANFSAENACIEVSLPKFSLDDTRAFAHDLGGGISSNFSLLIPFHLSLKAGRTWIKIRDYPVPLLYVPPSSDVNPVSWTLEGDYVAADETGDSRGSRIIPVSILPSGYTLSAVRTASPLKFYSIVDYAVMTDGMSIIGWSNSYKPAIQDIIRVLGTLTAAPVDPSPSLGWWDKIRFIYHSRIKVKFLSGDLAFVIKGTRNPYELNGHGAGMAKVWSKDIMWLVGYQNPQREFMQIISQEYTFGVPNLASDFIPQLPDTPATNNRVSLDERFLKVVLKLSGGIKMGIGMLFERSICDQSSCIGHDALHPIERCRTSTFMPHHQVTFKSPQYVAAHEAMDTYDSYRGFRSNFIHLSFSIVQLEDLGSHVPDDAQLYGSSRPHNAMYLSQCFIEYFSAWYDLFGGPFSLPVRQGSFWTGKEERTKGYGDHLDTVKYKIVLNSLSVGFFCSEEESYLRNGKRSLGLKAHARDFVVDLHSRRELLKHQDTVKVDRVFHEAKLQMNDIDLRAVKASNSQKAKNHISSLSYMDTPLQDIYSCKWVDPGDYVLLDPLSTASNKPVYLNVEVYPFLFSPLFYFVKQHDEDGIDKREYLRMTHECTINDKIDAYEFQKAYLNRRAVELDNLIEEYDQQLDTVIQALDTCGYKEYPELKNQHCTLSNKIDYLRNKRYILHNYIGQVIFESEFNNEGANFIHTGTSSVIFRDELSRWETLMGHFKNRCFIHNPQIIWNDSIRDIVIYWNELKSSRSVQAYNLSARCLQYLSGLANSADEQQRWKPDVPDNVDNRAAEEMAKELLQKLLSERDTNFVAYNEIEEAKREAKNHDGVYAFDNLNDDPDYQYNSIPEYYEMRSNFVVEMIHPQVILQSERGLDHLVLVTNQRMQIKSFEILDNSDDTAEKEIKLVKNRCIMSLNNAQLFIVSRLGSKEELDLIQHIYGNNSPKKHWAAWIQPEQLWQYQDLKYFENFQRIASQLSGTIQLDSYNPLRIKANKYLSSRHNPFEDRSNTVQLHFPQLKLAANSLQSHVLYYTISNLVLGRSLIPGKKKRMELFQEIMLAAERSDLVQSIKQVAVLQAQSRFLISMHKRFLNELPNLDDEAIQQYQVNKKKAFDSLERLYLVVEAIKSIQTFRQDDRLKESGAAMKLNFTADEIVWEALMVEKGKETSLCKWILQDTKYSSIRKPAGSSRHMIEVDRMQVINTTESPVFVQVLDTYIDQSTSSRDKILRGILDTLPPVGGIPIIQQLEVHVAPLHLQISMAFGSALKDYFFPRVTVAASERDSRSDDDEEEDTESITDGEMDENEESISIRPKLSRHSSSRYTSSRFSLKTESSRTSIEMLAKMMKDALQGKPKLKQDELAIMKKRSSTNRTFIYVKISGAKHCISLRGPSRNTLYNIYNFSFKQPSIEYRNKTWSVAKMVEEIQKQFLHAILRHSPALVKKKLLSNRKDSSQQSLEVDREEQVELTNMMSDSLIGSISSTKSSEYSSNDKQARSSKSVSLYTSEEENEDIKSLYSDPEDHLNNEYKNVDKQMAAIYLEKFKSFDDIIEKGKLLFGKSYNGPLLKSDKK
ncbi:hypothetical protein RMCBS344292_10052 [Rhizopus microsporus]|nr:hypothetical protein RMCBS344292_10052 [Rhizopus microsporus]